MASLTQSVGREKRASRTRHPVRAVLVAFLSALVGLGTGFVALYFTVIWPKISQWGATEAERQMALPGDELLPDAAAVHTIGVTVNAPPQAIWPWLMQLGVDRGGMYSYLWVENWLLRLKVENVATLHPEWQKLQVGDFIRFTPRDYAIQPGPGFYVLGMEPKRALYGCFGLENEAPDSKDAGTWQFVLLSQAANDAAAPSSTRLLLRSRTPQPDRIGRFTEAARKLGRGAVFCMERKMLLTLKARAESIATPMDTEVAVATTGDYV